MFYLMAVSHASSPTRAIAEGADDRLLRWAMLLFTAAVLLHNGDHARRGGDSLSADVFWVGSSAILLEVAIAVLVMQRHRVAPFAAMVTGFSLAAGYMLVHALPPRVWLSDALFSGGASRLSQVAAVLEIAAALILGTAGTVVLHRRGGAASATRAHPPSRSLRAALREPVVVIMAIGNAATFALLLASL